MLCINIGTFKRICGKHGEIGGGDGSDGRVSRGGGDSGGGGSRENTEVKHGEIGRAGDEREEAALSLEFIWEELCELEPV